MSSSRSLSALCLLCLCIKSRLSPKGVGTDNLSFLGGPEYLWVACQPRESNKNRVGIFALGTLRNAKANDGFLILSLMTKRQNEGCELHMSMAC